MSTGFIVTIAVIIFTLLLSRYFGETKATHEVAKELRLLRELLERKLIDKL